MFIIRPVKEKDLDGLMALLETAGHGLTSLPRDPEIIMARIRNSQMSFEHRIEGDPQGEDYLFIMEELFTGKVVGVSAIISKIGGFTPYYFYRLKEQQYSSKVLDRDQIGRSLHFQAIHNGPAEIASLYLSPDFRSSQNGRFLSLSRFLFVADNRGYFENEVIAEMRGRVDENGHSPFWDAVGSKIFQIDFTQADYLMMKDKRFVDELMPKHPVIVELLPKEAQEVIAEVHPNTVPARRILEKEGFQFSGLVGILEPGPVLSAKVDDIRAIRDSKVASITGIEPTVDSPTYIMSNGLDKFRACLGPVREEGDGKVVVSEVAAAALKLRLGDTIRYVTFKPA